jgi:Protein of unknown function (DUF1592)/Protein of unknown function (DUF1588)/Protein of unknown function (DUF1595)/Protein of unknown function (DUF1585)/Protein of unknown function (DUF1587)
MSPRLHLTLTAALLASACSGEIGGTRSGGPGSPGTTPGNDPVSGPSGPGGSSSGGPISGGPVGGPQPSDMPNVPGPAPLRRLSVREYRSTVRDLLGVDVPSGVDFAIDRDTAGFSVGSPVATSTDASRLLDAADQLAAAAASRLPGLLPCPTVPADSAGQSSCAQQFIQKFGRRAFRRPLSAEEVADLKAVYDAHRGAEINQGFPEAIQAVVAAMLVSPNFLYRNELGSLSPLRDPKDASVLKFNAHEMASRLSYALWGSMPDDQLFAQAEANKLGSAVDIETQVRRMLSDPKAAQVMEDFHLQWLEVDSLAKAPKEANFKDYTPQLVQAMLNETVGFTRDLMSSGSGKLADLLTGRVATSDPALAKLYGAAAGAMPDARQRAGLLTQASFLATHATTMDSNPVRRGAVVLKRLLCDEVPPPPNEDIPPPEPPKPGVTTRERFAKHDESKCATCHKLTDPIGFSFENYDAIGAYRQTDQGKPVDATGSLELEGQQLRFGNVIELLPALAGSKKVQDCVARQWLRYLLRRQETPGDEASLQLAGEAFQKSGFDMRELLVALAQSRAFTHRTLNAGEKLP